MIGAGFDATTGFLGDSKCGVDLGATILGEEGTCFGDGWAGGAFAMTGAVLLFTLALLFKLLVAGVGALAAGVVATFFFAGSSSDEDESESEDDDDFALFGNLLAEITAGTAAGVALGVALGVG